MAPRDHDRSRDKSKHHSKRSSNSSHPPEYPKAWSAWIWSDEHKKEYRAREVSNDQYQYEYRAPPSASATDSGTLAPIPESSASRFPSSAPLSQTDESGAMSSITRDMGSYSLGTGSQNSVQLTPPLQAHLTTQDPNTTEEAFDPNYRVHKQNDFRFGRIFKVLWAEPYGSGGGTEDSYRKGSFGQKFHEKVRRFVIIKQKEGHCLCLPIMTYGGQGTNKHGVHARDHAVIYTSQRPVLLAGEEKRMTKTPIKVIPYNARHKLDRASRINFTKIYTVECNVKVWFIGEVDPGSEWSLQASYEQENGMSQPASNQMPPAFAQPRSTPGYTSSGLNSNYSAYAQNLSMTNTPSYPTSNNPSGYVPSTPLSDGSSYSVPGYAPSNPAWPGTTQSYQPSSSSVATASYAQVQTASYTSNPPQQPYERDDDIYDRD